MPRKSTYRLPCFGNALARRYTGITMGMEFLPQKKSDFEPSFPGHAWEKIPEIQDPEDALEWIHELFQKGERPVVSVPEQYTEALTNGLTAHATWIPGFSAIVGTFGRDPYTPGSEKRALVKIDLDEDQIEPRFTGPSHAYQGVVVLRGPIKPEQLTVLSH